MSIGYFSAYLRWARSTIGASVLNACQDTSLMYAETFALSVV